MAMALGKGIILGLAAGLAVRLAPGQVALPTSWGGPWELGFPPAGWTFTGLGTDYNPDYDGLNNGAAKFQNTGNAITIHYDSPAGALSYWIRGLTFSGGVFRVEQSVDGADWQVLAVYDPPPAAATRYTVFPLAAARHLRFLYAAKVTGNVGLDGIVLARFIQPAFGALGRTGTVATATVAETVAGRTYALDHAPALPALTPVVWTPADTQTGTGGALELVDSEATDALRFYRVRDATP
jgi:hypothetical protein